jgi:hypothetical protein
MIANEGLVYLFVAKVYILHRFMWRNTNQIVIVTGEAFNPSSFISELGKVLLQDIKERKSLQNVYILAGKNIEYQTIFLISIIESRTI